MTQREVKLISEDRPAVSVKWAGCKKSKDGLHVAPQGEWLYTGESFVCTQCNERVWSNLDPNGGY